MSNLSTKQWVKEYMGRYSANKERLVDVYLEVYHKWRRRRGVDFPYASVLALKKACHHYYKYKDLFVKEDSDSYKMGEACKWILKWNPDFQEWADKQFYKQTAPAKFTTMRTNKYNTRRLKKNLHLLSPTAQDFARAIIENDGQWTDYYNPKPSRLYTESMSIQYVKREDRALMVDWHDYDFKNCHWAIFIQAFNLDPEYKEFVQQMLKDSDAFMTKVCIESGADYKKMKNRRNSILYGSKSGTGSPTLNRLRDLHQRYLAQSGKDASKLFYSLSRIEAKMLDVCKSLDPNWKLLMYDGWMTSSTIDTQFLQDEIKKYTNIEIIITKKA